MWTDDDARISQSVPALLALEKQRRSRPVADRVQLLRLRKAHTVRSLRAAAPVAPSSRATRTCQSRSLDWFRRGDAGWPARPPHGRAPLRAGAVGPRRPQPERGLATAHAA
jgi:hypothetical protein